VTTGARLRVLFLVEGEPLRGLSGPARFRVYQFVPWLERLGIECDVRPSRPPKYILARDGVARRLRGRPWLTSAALMTVSAAMTVFRWPEVRAASRYDVVVLQRDLLPFRTIPPFLERAAARRNPRVVFDFDDAIFTWPGRTPPAPGRRHWWRDQDKIGHVIAASRHVIAGNAMLATFARAWNPCVSIVPTTVDLEFYTPRPPARDVTPVTVGWSGTSGNLGYLQAIAPALRAAHRVRPIRLLIVCNRHSVPLDFGEVPVEQVEWTMQGEVPALHRMDIGLMPLPDDEWARGKCGFKAIQYMACEVPAVVSPVGVNAQLVADDVSGLHATTIEEWTRAVTTLSASPDLRRRLGEQGRRVVAREFSAQTWAGQFAAILRDVAGDRGRPVAEGRVP
jgi:glycosyltransferase involved in cell wall biosynthesis